MTINIKNINEFDLYNPPKDFISNCYQYYNLLREKNPIHRNPDGSYIITSHKDICEVYRNANIWSSDKKDEFWPKFGDSSLFEHHTNSVVFIDPPDHSRIRRIFQHAFTPKALKFLENDIDNLVENYLDEMQEKRIIDFVSDFAFKLPVDVVCNVLGVPKKDRTLIRDWARQILGALEPTLSDQQFKDGCDAVDKFKSYLKDEISFRRRFPKRNKEEEIMSSLINAEKSGIALSEVELLHQCIFMLNAGHETSTNMLSHGLNEFIENKNELWRIKKNINLIGTAVEEILRFQPPIQINNRRNKVESTLGGIKIPGGTSVHMILPAANRDPKEFVDPEIFNIARKPNRHLSFGLGIHICAGNSLARLEGKIAFRKIVLRFSDINLISKAKIANRLRFREIEELKVELIS